ncbi:MAG: hypothetical protein R3F65_09905 [bacterium]
MRPRPRLAILPRNSTPAPENPAVIAFFAGLLAGSAHVVTGPDHLAAVAPLAVAHPTRAAAAGARWGLGHGLGVAALGALGLAARQAIDIDAWSTAAESLVGFLLIAIGAWAIRRAGRLVIHDHPHAHDGDRHAHPHLHVAVADHDHPDAHRAHRHAPLWIGALHGAAGAGHLFGVLPALALPTSTPRSTSPPTSRAPSPPWPPSPRSSATSPAAAAPPPPPPPPRHRRPRHRRRRRLDRPRLRVTMTSRSHPAPSRPALTPASCAPAAPERRCSDPASHQAPRPA